MLICEISFLFQVKLRQRSVFPLHPIMLFHQRVNQLVRTYTVVIPVAYHLFYLVNNYALTEDFTLKLCVGITKTAAVQQSFENSERLSVVFHQPPFNAPAALKLVN